jgi:hypothetical protein
MRDFGVPALLEGWIRRWSSLFQELIIGKILKMEIYRKQQEKGVAFCRSPELFGW